MKFTLLTFAAVLLASAGIVRADDASINITGTIRDNTCSVSPDSQSKQVNLGNASSKNFQKAGDGSPPQIFVINLEKCGTQASNVTLSFTGQADGKNPDLLALDEGSGNATGIAIGIYDESRNLVPMGKPSGDYTLQPSQANVALKFFARYLATDDHVTSGNATATTTFVLNYD